MSIFAQVVSLATAAGIVVGPVGAWQGGATVTVAERLQVVRGVAIAEGPFPVPPPVRQADAVRVPLSLRGVEGPFPVPPPRRSIAG